MFHRQTKPEEIEGQSATLRQALILSNVDESNVSNLSNALSSLSSKNSCDLLGFEMHKRRMQPPHYSQSYSLSIPWYLDSPEHVLGLHLCLYWFIGMMHILKDYIYFLLYVCICA